MTKIKYQKVFIKRHATGIGFEIEMEVEGLWTDDETDTLKAQWDKLKEVFKDETGYNK